MGSLDAKTHEELKNYPTNPKFVILEHSMRVAGKVLYERREGEVKRQGDERSIQLLAKIIRSIDSEKITCKILKDGPDEKRQEDTDLGDDEKQKFYERWSTLWVPTFPENEELTPTMLILSTLEPFNITYPNSDDEDEDIEASHKQEHSNQPARKSHDATSRRSTAKHAEGSRKVPAESGDEQRVRVPTRHSSKGGSGARRRQSEGPLVETQEAEKSQSGHDGKLSLEVSRASAPANGGSKRHKETTSKASKPAVEVKIHESPSANPKKLTLDVNIKPSHSQSKGDHHSRISPTVHRLGKSSARDKQGEGEERDLRGELKEAGQSKDHSKPPKAGNSKNVGRDSGAVNPNSDKPGSLAKGQVSKTSEHMQQLSRSSKQEYSPEATSDVRNEAKPPGRITNLERKLEVVKKLFHDKMAESHENLIEHFLKVLKESEQQQQQRLKEVEEEIERKLKSRREDLGDANANRAEGSKSSCVCNQYALFDESHECPHGKPEQAKSSHPKDQSTASKGSSPPKDQRTASKGNSNEKHEDKSMAWLMDEFNGPPTDPKPYDTSPDQNSKNPSGKPTQPKAEDPPAEENFEKPDGESAEPSQNNPPSEPNSNKKSSGKPPELNLRDQPPEKNSKKPSGKLSELKSCLGLNTNDQPPELSSKKLSGKLSEFNPSDPPPELSSKKPSGKLSELNPSDPPPELSSKKPSGKLSELNPSDPPSEQNSKKPSGKLSELKSFLGLNPNDPPPKLSSKKPSRKLSELHLDDPLPEQNSKKPSGKPSGSKTQQTPPPEHKSGKVINKDGTYCAQS